MLNEQVIKAAIISKVRNRITDKHVLISEMVFSQGARRADLVVANGHLHAYEVKSDLDTLKRLDGQVLDYLSRFDKLVLVVSSKFVEKALETNERVGVWEATETASGKVRIRIIRPGRLESVSNIQYLCEFLLKSELSNLVRSKAQCARALSLSRAELMEYAAKLPVSVVRDFVLRSIKFRYESVSSCFLQGCSKGVSPEDILGLSRSKIRRKLAEDKFESFVEKTGELKKRVLDLSRFFPQGDIPENIPRFVLVPPKD